MNHQHNSDEQDGAPSQSSQGSEAARMKTYIKDSWRVAETLYLNSLADRGKYRGQITDALYGAREPLGGRSLIEATARIIVHRLLRQPHVKRDTRRGTEKWMQYHYDLAKVETDFTQKEVKQKLMDKFKIDGSATDYLNKRGFNPPARAKAGQSKAKLETYLSDPMKNAIIDFLWQYELVPPLKKDDAMAANIGLLSDYSPTNDGNAGLPAAGMRNANAQDTDSIRMAEAYKRDRQEAMTTRSRYTTEIDLDAMAGIDDADDPLFAHLDAKRIAEEFMSELPDEAHRSVFWTFVMNGNNVSVAAGLLGLGQDTIRARMKTIEKMRREYLEKRHFQVG